ncbi:AarF/ABC1/UbiB kinase family protein [Streptomyces sp. LX-29]|uniref:ABC1 kinase family protein n=1 Tax=Streptomyces sp. LX-29 TaxID=2900152 RepID=UPI00240DE83C|nr:AarF/ABC1/UbiB kinase family protein [Streptomyces sp. LX-29]WFB05859.1 AarF/ABC1/UbiB kinase family protein [Streptomyces sp. LX-29]
MPDLAAHAASVLAPAIPAGGTLAASAAEKAATWPLAAVVAAASLSLFMVGVSVGSRRLLGIRVGLLRTFTAGLAGLASFHVFGALIDDKRSLAALSTVGVTLSLLAAMTVLVVIEVAFPSGSWIRPVRWLRRLRRRLVRARRYSQISRIFMRHDLGRYVRGRASLDRAAHPDEAGLHAARSLRLALEECGGTFIKLGQVLSTRRDLLPPHIVDELSRLQNDVPPAPWPEVEAVLLEELGAPVDQAFAEFDREPLAAASIAQVHRARLRDGTTVAVKVQRPGVRESVERDLDIVLAIAQGLHVRARAVQAFGLRDLADGFAVAVREELDFRIEARNADAVAAACGGHAPDARVKVPRVHHRLSSARVLVQEWLDGVTLERAGAVADERGLDREELARTLLGAMLRQIMRDGVFHADPHPGNMLLLADGARVGLLDFGSVGRIDPVMRAAIQHLLMAVDRGDPAGMCDALLELLGPRADGPGGEEPELDTLLLERELGRFMARHLGAAAHPDVEMFTALFRLLTHFGLTVPPEAAAVFRALATLEGTLTRLSPGFNLVDEARRTATELLTDRLSGGDGGPGGVSGRIAARAAESYARWTGVSDLGEPTADGASLTRTVAQEILPLLPMLRRLPRRAERISSSVEQGRLGMRVRVLADERDRRYLSGLFHQLLVALMAVGTGMMGVMMLVFGTGRGPDVTADLGLFPMLGYNLLAVSAVLTLRVLYTAMRRSP